MELEEKDGEYFLDYDNKILTPSQWLAQLEKDSVLETLGWGWSGPVLNSTFSLDCRNVDKQGFTLRNDGAKGK